MHQPWIVRYVQLALRMHRAIQRTGDMPFVDTYYGPADLQAAVEQEPERSCRALLDDARGLAVSLPAQDFAPQRAAFLAKHVMAMETLCRRLGGETLAPEEEIRRCLDIQPAWKPEVEFEQTLALLDETLPGAGDVRTRYQDWQARITVPASQAQAVPQLMRSLLAEARRRTQRIVELPLDEGVDIATVQGVSYGAANWYLGGYRSRLELNLDRPVNVLGLLYQMCHEVYPGHHTEFALKELHLYRERGYLEQSVFIVGPQLVIAEAIASLALEMTFTPDEVAEWASTRLFPELGIRANDVDLGKLVPATLALSLDDLTSNLMTMLHNGAAEGDAVEYALTYTPFTEQQVHFALQWLSTPLRQMYAYTYYHGKRLMQPLLKGADRAQVFRHLLTEQTYPSLLVQWQSQAGPVYADKQLTALQ